MMIPSGWIHAVWTPENSLVVGGNFLTRMNYEMQIKVNRIEIDTKTALKFRYPLFQKVNWYAAIRYLEDDPVPEEVLDDFEDDPDYVFLRANPVWHEFGDLQNDAESGDPFYNARFYSRMEIEGLPALREYLYRTALIASDFHVDGVTETARTNVKKSIPKGHGEPMDLIRSFGIWVAWKTGCVVAPDWVRPDSPSLSSLARKAEKQKKSDVMRTPGERMSSRVQSQLEHARAETVNTPSKRRTSSIEPEIVKDETKRPRRTPKTSGLGPQRFACDPCRKRRIRCRHREWEGLATPDENGNTRTYSSISVDIPRPVPSQSFSSFDGPRSSPQAGNADPLADSKYGSPTLPLQQEANEFNNQPAPVQMQMQDSMMMGASSGKKGRTKACEECRKSKVRSVRLLMELAPDMTLQRRCIHDENGKVDPFKAAEPSKPRGSTSAKRPARLSDDYHASAKKPRVDEGENDTILVDQAQSALAEAYDEQVIEEDDFDSLIDPSLRLQPAIQQLQAAADAMIQSAHEMHEAAGPDSVPDKVVNGSSAEEPTQARLTISIDPQLQAPTTIKIEPHPVALAPSSAQISATSLVSPPDSLRNDDEIDNENSNEKFSPTFNNADMNMSKSVDVNGEAGTSSSNESTSNPLRTPKSAASRHSSRHSKPVDRYVPDNNNLENSGKKTTSSSITPKLVIKKEPRRASSSGASIAATTNPTSDGDAGEEPKSRRASSHATTASPSVSAAAILQQQHEPQRVTSLPGLSNTNPKTAAISPSSSCYSSSLPSHNLDTTPNHGYHVPTKATTDGRGSRSGGGPAEIQQTQQQLQLQQHTRGQEVPLPLPLELEADAESLRLIRALHEEEFGLRSRGRSGMRA